MRRLTQVLLVATAVAQLGRAHAQTAADILTAGCAEDAQKLCAGVQSGGGRIIACLKQHKDSLSAKCKQAAAQVANQSSGGAANAAPAVPSGGARPSTGDSTDSVTAAHASSGGGSTTGTGTKTMRPSATVSTAPTKSAEPRGSYLLMKQVSVTGPGPDPGTPYQPSYDLLVPSAWKFAGTSIFMSPDATSGCFADAYATNILVTSPDGSIVFQAVPDYSWQYADDPSIVQNLSDPNRRALGAGGKKCAVAKPVRAEEYLRQSVLPKLGNDTTLVSVEPFPALNEIVRQRRGLPPEGGNTGATRTEAIRARTTFQKDGKEMEAWVALAVVVDISPAGRGSFYDSHATSFVALTAPKGKLDANDRLFRVMIGSIHPEPKWVTYSNRQLAILYQAEAQKESAIDQIHAALLRKELATIQSVTANMMAGSNASAMRADQNIREVQTFRDPSTGRTMELSSLYDHAWLNGSNQYVMSDDPNFNPNGNLNGSWNRLQAVNP